MGKLQFAVFVFKSSADDRAPVGMRSAGIDAAIAFAQDDILVMKRRLTALAGYYRSGELLEEHQTDRNDLPLADALAHYDPLRPEDTVHFAARERDPRRVSEEPSGEQPASQPFRVPVMFETDRRKLAESPLSLVEYTSSRGDGTLAYGVTEVSIPGNRHKPGRVERPSLWKFWEGGEDTEKHIVIKRCEETNLATWARIARERIAEAGAALIFIHGFNVSFAEAIRNAAQIGWDLEFDGLITAFSWCSRGNVSSYFADEPNARRAAPRFLEFVRVLRKNARVKTIHVIAHSMGNVVLLEALRKMPRSRKRKAALEEVVLAAPDYDAGELTDALKELGGKARRFFFPLRFRK